MATRTTRDLINKAFFLINEYSPNELPSSYEVNEALDYLNDLLGELSESEINIPTTDELAFNFTPDKASYTFGRESGVDVVTNKIIDVFDCYILDGGVQFPLTEILHDEAYQITRYPDATSRPSQYFFDRHNVTSTIVFFDTPDTNYELHLRSKVILSDLDLDTVLHENVHPSYIRFLRYALARELSHVFDTNNWSPLKEEEYKRIFSDLQCAGETDWSLTISSVLMKRSVGWNKAQIISG